MEKCLILGWGLSDEFGKGSDTKKTWKCLKRDEGLSKEHRALLMVNTLGQFKQENK